MSDTSDDTMLNAAPSSPTIARHRAITRVPARLRSVASAAREVERAQAPCEVLRSANSLRDAVHHARPCRRAEPAILGETNSKIARRGELRAARNMRADEREAYHAWRSALMSPPHVPSWHALTTSDPRHTNAARDFPAAPEDLAALYATSGLSLPHLAAWLADPAKSTADARGALRALARVRRVRTRVAKMYIGRHGNRVLHQGAPVNSSVLNRKDLRVVNRVLKLTRRKRFAVVAQVRRAMAALDEVQSMANLIIEDMERDADSCDN